MASAPYNMVQQTVSGTPGTGTVTLGTAVSPWQTLASAGALTGQKISYSFVDYSIPGWEVGIGIYNSSGPTITRGLRQSSTGSLLSLTSAAIFEATFIDSDVPRNYSGPYGRAVPFV